ncbi:carotenoid oxygenase family protein [Sphingomonas sp.]|uniref:carotenoid oxygenase family protein n=1 Tax=Sphingomonas sp. TaxID=28214 RepID=UPI000DB7868B|nr:carotenoid oxygenase family protein [Sphingomonas sp.]PZU11082.1 MAG: lignostilbene alpha-beta-dioxygenase [Sphingomonas sp.]
MKAFPNSRNFTGYFAPSRIEADIADLEVIQGAVPAEIDGIFHRVAPDPHFPPLGEDDIWFNGDGMVTAFAFRDGRVDLKQRWVETDKFKLEREAGHALFGAYRNPLTDDESVEGVYRGTANTNVVVHAGVLLALKEDSPPVAMDPVSLKTIGNWDFHGTMKSPTFTAHPKIDTRTGELLAFGYAARGLLTRDMVYYVIGPDGRVAHEVWFELPYYCMMHDFGITENYVIFHVVPITSNWERLEQGKPHFGFDTERDIYLGVLPRRGTAEDLRWFRGPNQFASHVMNAFDEGTKIHFDTPAASGNMFPFFPDINDAPFDPVAAQAHMTRWTVDMAANEDGIAARRLTDLVGEFPRIDDRFAGRPYRHGYILAQDKDKPFEVGGAKSATGLMMNTLAHIDIETGAVDSWWIGATSSLQEPAFIPRPGSTQEGDGWLVVVENLLVEMRSNLLLFDARNLSAGPVATIVVPMRLRPALHGNFVAGGQLQAAVA